MTDKHDETEFRKGNHARTHKLEPLRRLTSDLVVEPDCEAVTAASCLWSEPYGTKPRDHPEETRVISVKQCLVILVTTPDDENELNVSYSSGPQSECRA